MPEAVVENALTQESLGWRAGLPDDLKQNEALKAFKTVGDFAKDDLAVRSKVSELEGKLSNYVPKLPDNASDEDRNLYYNALGRPKQPSEYKLQGEDKNAPEWNENVRKHLWETGTTESQAEAHVKWFNGVMQEMVNKANANLKVEVSQKENGLRSKYGDKFETNVELAKRLYHKIRNSDLDKDFDRETSVGRSAVIDILVDFASRTGEDRSPQGGMSQSSAKSTFIDYSKSPAPPKKS
jgi:hypothetical protein